MTPSPDAGQGNEPRIPHPPRKNPLSWALATILLVAAIAAAFWVPIYARTSPKLGAFPFFYWYQLILVPVVAIVSWLAYLLVRAPVAVKPPRRAGPGEVSDGGQGVAS